MKALVGVAVALAVCSILLIAAAVPLALALPLRADSPVEQGSAAPPNNSGGPLVGAAVSAPPVTAGQLVADIPPSMLELYVSARPWCPGLPWTVLAGIGKVETDHGRGAEVSPAGAEGPMQFMPATWAAYAVDGDGDGVASIWDAADAVPAAAHYLCANGGGDPAGLRNAIWHYNHDDSYVEVVLAWAARYAAAASA
jgi:Transglycosylase SLT domain